MQEAQETQVQSLGWEDPPEEDMATHSSILAWRITWTEESGGLQFTGLQRVEHDLSNLAHMYLFYEVILVLFYFYLQWGKIRLSYTASL